MDKQEPAHEPVSSELNRYIDQTRRIRELSSPGISSFTNEDDYRKRLLDNFRRIRSYAKENNLILNRLCYPYLADDALLGGETVAALTDFSRRLYDSFAISQTDAVLMYRLAKRFLKEAEETGDDSLRIRALDFMISATYHLTYMRFDSAATRRFRDEGWAAVKTAIAFLEKERFILLNPTEKLYLMRMASYYLRLFVGVIFEDQNVNPERNAFVLQSLIDMLDRLNDPFYLEQLPADFDRALYCVSTQSYIAAVTDDHNAAGFDKEQLALICTHTEQLKKACREYGKTNAFIEALKLELPLYLCRNAYLADKTDEEEYRRALREIFDAFADMDLSDEMPTVVINTAREYLLIAAKKPLDAEDTAFLSRVYARFTGYIHQAPKDNLFGYLIADASTILALFIDIPGGIGFEAFCLSTIAAIHPPTYVHTLSVASFSKCLAHHLIGRMPSLFLGVCGCGDEAEVTKRAAEIEDFVYHAALCHDFGKLLVAETIMNYGRDLLAEETEMIAFHPVAGARLLERHADTAPYVDVALGHHKWYNNRGGYPDVFDIDASPIKNVIAIVICADCLDAATDAVGRSYKDGKSLDHFLEELQKDSGTRYAPWLLPLFEDGEIRAEIETLMTEGRDENYHKTYRILSDGDGRAER